MTRPRLIISGTLAGIGVFLVQIWPVLLIWKAGASGSVGDLSEVRVVSVSTVYVLAVAVLSGWLTARAVLLAYSSPAIGRLDPWGAYALGIGVYNLALTAVPAIMYGLLLVDENKSLQGREWLVHLLWIGGNVGAATIGFLAARFVLPHRDPLPAN